MTRAAAMVAAALLASGCGSYALRGRVVEGSVSRVEVVDDDDPRLSGPPLADASVTAVLEPDSLDRERLPERFSGETGGFEVPVSAAGAGLLNYDVRVIGRLPGYAPADAVFRLPGRGKRVLVTLTPGRDTGVGLEPDLLEESLRYRDAFER